MKTGKFFFDVGHAKLNKSGEELCGDNIQITTKDQGVLSVLSDGLGSGVKANILSTLTSKIAITMLEKGAPMEDVVSTIIHTLPECKVRGLAYSTFTILSGLSSGRIYITRFDNPPVILKRKNEVVLLEGNEVQIYDKKVKESEFNLNEDDIIVAISDGILHAGIGRILNMGWQENDLAAYIKKLPSDLSSMSIARKIINTCNYLYGDKPQDDASCIVLKYRQPKNCIIFTGPPIEKNDDKIVVERLLEKNSIKVVCGGTAAKIVSRELQKPVNIDMSNTHADLPPIAYIKGIDLVTEGVLTLSRVLQILTEYQSSNENIDDIFINNNSSNAAYMLLKILLDEATHIHILFGRRVNPAHEEIGVSEILSSKLEIIKGINEILQKLGKTVTIEYF